MYYRYDFLGRTITTNSDFETGLYSLSIKDDDKDTTIHIIDLKREQLNAILVAHKLMNDHSPKAYEPKQEQEKPKRKVKNKMKERKV